MDSYLIVIGGLSEPYYGLNFRKELPGWYLQEHQHDFYQFFYILEGCLNVRVGYQYYDITSGQICMVPPFVPHTLNTTKGYLQFGINLQSNLDERGIINLLNTYVTQLTVLAKPLFLESIPILRNETEKLTLFSKLKVTTMLDHFIIACIEDIMDLKENGFREKLISILQRNLSHNIKLDDIVKEMAISQTHLERLSNSEFGCGVIELFHRLKMDYACSLLLDSNKTVSEIAYMLGYKDVAYFSRFFKKKLKMTPGEYRKKF